MHVHRVSVVVALLVTGATAVLAEQAAERYYEIPGVREYTGQLIARPMQPDGTRAAEATHEAAAVTLAHFDLIEYVWQTDEHFLLVPAGRTELEVIDDLMATGMFQYVEPNWRVYPLSCPNDPQFGSQWHHQANRMQSCDGWNLHTGTPSTVVAICDTGVRTTHQDLLLHRMEGFNAWQQLWESEGGAINDINGHGTATTGCAAANGNNGVGVAGVGWNLSHRMMRVTDDPGGSAYLGILQYAARTAVEAGDKVASVSYSGVDSESNLTTATYIKSIGGLLVWAAGNDGRNLTMNDRDADDLIVAGGTDSSDAKAGFSAYGVFVDVVAPAVNVYTTSNGGNSSYSGATGTSFACPLTAGLCALIFSAYPDLEPDNVEAVLKAGAEDLGAAGVDSTYGYGRINVYLSLNFGQTYCVGDAITQQPQPQDACVHDDLNFSVSDTVASPSYQWQKDGVDLSNGGRISGANTPALTIVDAVIGDAGQYRCRVTNTGSGCVRTSQPAAASVGLCGTVTQLVPNDTVPSSGADLATFERNVRHFTYDLVMDTTGYPSDWTASEVSVDVVAPQLGSIWHASDETNFGPPLENLNVPLLAESSADTRVFDTFLAPPLNSFLVPATLASPGGLVSTDVRIRGISGQGAEIPLAWFDTAQDNSGSLFVGGRLTFELVDSGEVSTDPVGDLFVTITGRTTTVANVGGEAFSFNLYAALGSNPCPWDLDHDGTIELDDLSVVLVHFGTTSGAGPEDGDFDGDGDVDLDDLSELLVRFGQACP